MTSTDSAKLTDPPLSDEQDRDDIKVYAAKALREAKQEGLWLAVRARWIALAVIAVLLPIVNFHWSVLYYHVILIASALIGYAQLRVGRVGQSRPELFLIYCDILLITAVAVVTNPFAPEEWPAGMQYRYGSFIFFFVILAGATLAYSWRTVVAFGLWTAIAWSLGFAWLAFFGNHLPEMTTAIQGAFPDDPALAGLIDPNAMHPGWRFQEIVVFAIVAGILALTVKRSADLLESHASSERARNNLARYFSPTVVDELAKNDEPLKEVRMQNVAVLFVDIVGFTKFAHERGPTEIIAALREFHGAMEQEVFRHGGTLDKYLGDGLMATFGTPFAGDTDASDALKCAFSMIEASKALNDDRLKRGQVPLQASFGLHYGPVVLGDIGANRLEFAVIGDTVNVANRLESMTRTMDTALVVSDETMQQIQSENGEREPAGPRLIKQAAQAVRGLGQSMVVWTPA
ncbi:MAG: adenylate/guanylate cyclase domain-containing protein [Pseudomonadota bacterium]